MVKSLKRRDCGTAAEIKITDDTGGLKSGLNLNELITDVNIEINKLAN